MTVEQDPDSKYAFTNDTLGRVTQVDTLGTPGMPRMILTVGYGGYNNRTTLHDNFTTTITYGFDLDERLTSVSMVVNGAQGPQVTMAYDAASRETGITRKVSSTGSIIFQRIRV